MIYIEISGEKYPCKFSTFHTQTGKDAIRIISEAPIAEGFRLVGEDDSVIADYSDYIYLYREDGDTIKEYTAEADEIIPAEGNISGVPVNPIQRQISALNRRITDITPYTATKTAYFGETEVTFYDVPEGKTIVFFDDNNGEYSINRLDNRLIVSFDALDKDTEITVQIQ